MILTIEMLELHKLALRNIKFYNTFMYFYTRITLELLHPSILILKNSPILNQISLRRY